ncbi:MAG: hypothetical protein CMO55_12655 [Verrucomicrobiales bacterium]|nr:hypothetical protein [Verrucomicrobiales bacterium]
MLRWLCTLLAFSLVTTHAADYPFFAFQNGVRLPTDELRADLLKKIGFDGIGSANLPEDGDLDRLFTIYKEWDLRVFSFYTGANLTEDGATVPDALIEAIPKMKGTNVVIEFFIKGRKSAPRKEAVDIVRKIADLAAQSEVQIVLYPHAGMYVETLTDATTLAREVDRDNVGVMFNLCHFLRIEPKADLKETLTSAGDLLRQVSISGADVGGQDWSELIQPLGKGTYDVSQLFDILEEIDFKGPIGLQCYNIPGKSEDFLTRSFAAWRSLKNAK